MSKQFEGFAAHSAARVQDECVSQIVHFTKQAEAIVAELDSAQEIAIKRLMTKGWFPCKTREAAIACLDMEYPAWHLDPRRIRLGRLRDTIARLKLIKANAEAMLANVDEPRADIFLTHSEAALVFTGKSFKEGQ